MAKRMLLISPDQENLNKKLDITHIDKPFYSITPIDRKLSTLDTELNNIINNSSLHIDNKLNLYQDVLTKYIDVVNYKNKIKFPLQMSKAPLKYIAGRDTIEKEIMEGLPVTMRNAARIILNKIKNNTSHITWDAMGQVVFNGKTLTNSNLYDLIHDVVSK